MQLLRADSKLRAKAKFAAVRKARGGVDVNAGRVNLALKGSGARTVFGNDAFAVLCVVAVDVFNRLLNVFNGVNKTFVVQKFVSKILVCGRNDARGAAVFLG